MSQLLLVLSSVLICLTVTAWGITADRSESSPAPVDSPIVAGGRRFHRIPTANTHRVHGRHRAR